MCHLGARELVISEQCTSLQLQMHLQYIDVSLDGYYSRVAIEMCMVMLWATTIQR